MSAPGRLKRLKKHRSTGVVTSSQQNNPLQTGHVSPKHSTRLIIHTHTPMPPVTGLLGIPQLRYIQYRTPHKSKLSGWQKS